MPIISFKVERLSPPFQETIYLSLAPNNSTVINLGNLTGNVTATIGLYSSTINQVNIDGEIHVTGIYSGVSVISYFAATRNPSVDFYFYSVTDVEVIM